MTRERSGELDRERLKGRLLQVMIEHTGRSRMIGMGELYERVFGEGWEHRINDTRRLRKLIEELRREGTPISYDTTWNGGGYYVASTTSEMADLCGRIRAKALRLLRMEAQLRRISLPELHGQLRLDMDGAAAGGGEEGR